MTTLATLWPLLVGETYGEEGGLGIILIVLGIIALAIAVYFCWVQNFIAAAAAALLGVVILVVA